MFCFSGGTSFRKRTTPAAKKQMAADSPMELGGLITPNSPHLFERLEKRNLPLEENLSSLGNQYVNEYVFFEKRVSMNHKIY